tara:strand:+ start:619 stop:1065 length:447 start_codon:yes stop_codon:yes gene_type:complete
MGAAGYGISAVMSLAAARQAQKAYANDAQASYEQAEMAKIQADQEAINRTAELNAKLASISASAGSGGVAVSSGSIKNIRRRETQLASADVGAIQTMGLQNRRKYKLEASSKKTKGKASMISGVGSAVTSGTKGYNALGKNSKFRIFD